MENFVEDEFQSQSGSDEFEAGTGHDQNVSENQSPKRKTYHRHTSYQIQELEAFFNDNPHPDEKARLDLGKRLGMENKQVKFWFQNRRTQVKTQDGRKENSNLRKENEKLWAENMAMKQALKNPICSTCGGPAVLGEIPAEQHHLKAENSKLKEELNRLNILLSDLPPSVNNSRSSGQLIGQGSVPNSLGVGLATSLNPSSNASHIVQIGGPAIGDPRDDKLKLVELAVTAMDEFIALTQLGDPVWFKSLHGTGESLNVEEYKKVFSSLECSNLISQGTKASGVVMIDTPGLIEAFFDPAKWIQLFPLTIGRATTVDVICAGLQGNRNGAMHMIQAEFQVPLPMIPVCQLKFVRFCKQQGHDIWAVVDISLEAILGSSKCRRLPSGCIVQHMPNGYSKVTWVEHIAYEENAVHQAYRPLIRSGMAFGAHMWLTDLQTQLEIFHCTIAMPLQKDNARGYTPDGRKSITKLAMRMMRSFVTSVCSTVHNWKLLEMKGDSKFMVRSSIGGEPNGMILSAVTTIWIPILPQCVFEFLQNDSHRVFWDTFSKNGPMQKFLQIPKTQNPCNNNITLLRHGSDLVNDNYVVILQDTCTNAFGSYIVHATLDSESTSKVLEGVNSTNIAILPYGFAIVPFRHSISTGPNGEGGSTTNQGVNGSLLTAGFQVFMSSDENSKPSLECVESVKGIIDRTLTGIKTGLQQVV